MVLISGTYTNKSDVWSFGVLMWELLTRCALKPYPDIKGHREFMSYLRHGGRLEKPASTPVEIWDIMRSCWHKRPDERPTFAALAAVLKDKLESSTHQHVYRPVGYSGNTSATTLQSGSEYLEIVPIPDESFYMHKYADPYDAPPSEIAPTPPEHIYSSNNAFPRGQHTYYQTQYAPTTPQPFNPANHMALHQMNMHI